MLILARRVGERVYIETPQGRITLMIYPFEHRGRVNLGIQAPLAFSIMRAELVDEERKRA